MKTLTLPVSTLVAIASITDDTLREHFISTLQNGTANPDSLNPDDYADADPLVRELVDRITRRAAQALRRKERKAQKQAGKKTETTHPTEASPLEFTRQQRRVHLPVNDKTTRRFLWFKHNFRTFTLEAINTLKSIEGETDIYQPLIDSFEYLTNCIATVIDPIALQVSKLMKMPRNSRPARLDYIHNPSPLVA